MLLTLELIAVTVFAITGVATAIEKELDMFGALVMGLCTSVGGGIVRDILLGYLPPKAFIDPIYSITALISSFLFFITMYIINSKIKPHMEGFNKVINVLDSIGLSLFTVSGVSAAIECGFGGNLYLSVFVGVMTGVGGGVMRDVLSHKAPVIFHKRIYALAALAGAILYQQLMENEIIKESVAFICSAALIFVIRMLATIFRWDLPKVKRHSEEKAA